jgi:hypothetical protein
MMTHAETPVSVKRISVGRVVRFAAGGIHYGSYGSQYLENFETGRADSEATARGHADVPKHADL